MIHLVPTTCHHCISNLFQSTIIYSAINLVVQYVLINFFNHMDYWVIKPSYSHPTMLTSNLLCVRKQNNYYFSGKQGKKYCVLNPCILIIEQSILIILIDLNVLTGIMITRQALPLNYWTPLKNIYIVDSFWRGVALFFFRERGCTTLCVYVYIVLVGKL